MPTEQDLPQPNELLLTEEPFVIHGKGMGDEYALSLVNQTFFQYERWRDNNQNNRWITADRLYFGWVDQRFWDGSNVPRASLSRQLVFEKVESAMPIVLQNLFPSDDWIGVEPEPGTDVKQARDVRDHLRYALEHKNQYGFSSQIDVAQAVKSGLIYGNGFVALEWDGLMKHPTASWVDIRDIYIDPATPGPFIDYARSVIRRRMMTVDELEALRSDTRIKLPSLSVLWGMARNRALRMADNSKRVMESQRNIAYSPGFDDWLPLPSDNQIEVLIYYSPTRIIWVLNQRWVAYNEANPYGFIPLCSFPCYTVLGRFYAMSMSDALEQSQLYIQALFNARLDELHLALQPPRTGKRASVMGGRSTFLWHPGATNLLDDPAKEVVIHYPENATASVAEEIQIVEMNAERGVGVNALSSGTPRGGNINRTATGVSAQVQTGNSRLQTIVKNVEDFLIVPMLYKMYRMIQYHSGDENELPALDENQQTYNVSASSFFASVKFRMTGASKMLSRDKLQQAFPFVMQYLMSGPFMQELSQTGYTVDFLEVFRMMADATGINRGYDLIRQMNEQEQQARQQIPPQIQAQMQMKQQDGQVRLQAAQMKAQSEQGKTQMEHDTAMTAQEEKSAIEILKLLMASQPDPAKLMESQMKVKLAQQKGQHDMQLAHQKHQMDMTHSAQEHQQKMQQNAQQIHQQMQLSSAQQLQQLAHQKMQAQQDRENAAQDHALALGQSATSHEQTLANTQEKHSQDLETAKKMAGLKALGLGKKAKSKK